MICTISAKNCSISDMWQKDIERYGKKIVEFLPDLDPSVVLLDFVIKKGRTRGPYQGSIALHLPIHNLHADFQEYNLEKGVHKGFDRLVREVKKYKETHLVSDSQYPRHDSIRRDSRLFIYPLQWSANRAAEVSDPPLFEKLRKILVKKYVKPAGVTNKRVLTAIGKVPREEFVLPQYKKEAYLNMPLPIGEGQTISQPSLVAIMTQALKLKGKEKVLEIGTGSGYQAAVLSYLAKSVYTVERFPSLARRAERILKHLGYNNVYVFIGNGTLGLSKFAPFDVIIVTAAASKIPDALEGQLKEGGRIVIPIENEDGEQKLVVGKKRENKIILKEIVEAVRFVPLIEEHAWKSKIPDYF